MNGSNGRGGRSGRAALALALSTVGFFALTIFGFGMTSLLLDEDVIAVPGLGPWPGITGMLLALATFAGVLAAGLWSRRPSYLLTAVVAVAVFLAEVLGIALGAAVSGAPAASAIAAAGAMATGWFGAAIGAAALIAAWAAIAMVRTRAQPPRWPWERRESGE